jgi:FHA domain
VTKSPTRPKTSRTLLIADHVWEAFANMALEMGSERDALVNQALYTFARLNGFVIPGDPQRRARDPSPALTQTGEVPGNTVDLQPVEPPAQLVLLCDGRELDRVAKDRFLIGRGKHCDLVIHSGKVSREHAAILREGRAWFIEDLGSSNGTWFDAHRITRRQIHDGDEYFISSEKLSCTFR